MKNKKEKSDNLATPGKPMTQKKFTAMIKEAEEGEFLTDAQFRAKFQEWKSTIKK